MTKWSLSWEGGLGGSWILAVNTCVFVFVFVLIVFVSIVFVCVFVITIILILTRAQSSGSRHMMDIGCEYMYKAKPRDLSHRPNIAEITQCPISMSVISISYSSISRKPMIFTIFFQRISKSKSLKHRSPGTVWCWELQLWNPTESWFREKVGNSIFIKTLSLQSRTARN